MAIINRKYPPKKIAAVNRLKRCRRKRATLADQRAHALTGRELLARGKVAPPLPRLALACTTFRCRWAIDVVRCVAYAHEQRYAAWVATHDQFAELAACSWRSAQRAVDEAEAHGWVERHHYFAEVAGGHEERPFALVPGPALLIAFERAEEVRARAPGARQRAAARELAAARAKWSNQFPRKRAQTVGPSSTDLRIATEPTDRQDGDPIRDPLPEEAPEEAQTRVARKGAPVGRGRSSRRQPPARRHPAQPAELAELGTREPAPPAPQRAEPPRSRPPTPAALIGGLAGALGRLPVQRSAGPADRETLNELLARLRAQHGVPP